MQEQRPARRGGAAFIWKWGAISGIILGMIQIIISLGLFAARQTGRVGTGALVGLVTGLIGGLIGWVLFVRDRLIDVHSS